MEENKVLYNGRERFRRGQISNFDNLPTDVKNNFRKIKELIEKYFDKEMDVRVIGSHLEGYYDEISDYDVVIKEDCNTVGLEKIISSNCQLNVNIIFDTTEYSTSIIK